MQIADAEGNSLSKISLALTEIEAKNLVVTLMDLLTTHDPSWHAHEFSTTRSPPERDLDEWLTTEAQRGTSVAAVVRDVARWLNVGPAEAKSRLRVHPEWAPRVRGTFLNSTLARVSS